MITESMIRNCPICTTGQPAFIKNVPFQLFDGHPMNGGYDLVQCTVCGFVYADTPITQAQLDSYYAELSKYEDKTISTGGGYSPNDKQRLVDTVAFVTNWVPDKSARIVDLGCANGGLLQELKNAGYTNIVGIDPSASCVATTIDAVGCPAYQCSLFNIPEAVGTFDVVLSTHVLEHLLDVREAVAIMRRIMNDGAIVYLECPNASHYHKVVHAPLQEFNSEHINHFNETSFRNLMEHLGFDVLTTDNKIFKISSGQDYHAVYGLFRKSERKPSKWSFDSKIKGEIDTYITISDKMFGKIASKMDALGYSYPVALLGIGQLAFKLMKTKAFATNPRLKFFDNNASIAGNSIYNTTILHGSQIVAEYLVEPFTIVITSLIHERPIREGIMKRFAEQGIQPPNVMGFSEIMEDVEI